MKGRTDTKFRSFLSSVLVLAPFLLLRSTSNAFTISSKKLVQPQLSRFISPADGRTNLQRTTFHEVYAQNARSIKPWYSSSTTSLSMYNLPPGGSGGGGGDKNEISEVAKSVGSLLLVVGFFISPLGGFVLGIFNSFLLLAFLLPLLATVGFQVWSSLNTVKGECPNCGAPATVMKTKSSGTNVVDDVMPAQSICFSCGAVLQANDDNTGINNVSGRTSIDDLNSPMGGQSIFDLFSTPPQQQQQASTTRTSETRKNTSDSGVDKGAVIDVDILDDDKPFQ